MKIAITKSITGGLLVVLVSGCAGIVNPHISWEPPTGAPDFYTLPYAIKYADNAKTAYKDALGNQAQLASWLGIGIIPLMAAAGGLGMTGGPVNAIAVTTLTSVAGYGVGTWLYSKPYQRAWVAGYNATSCAVSAIIPLRYVESRRPDIRYHLDFLGLKQKEVIVNQEKLNEKIEIAGAANSENEKVHQAKKKTVKQDKLKEKIVLQANKKIKEADELVKSVKITRGNALKMLAKADTSGQLLKEAVDRISGQVSGQLVENGPDLQTLSSIVGGLAQSYRSFSSVPDTLGQIEKDTSNKPQDKSKKSADRQDSGEAESTVTDVKSAMDALAMSLTELAKAQQAVTDDFSILEDTTPYETLRSCGVTAEQVSIPLSIEPSGAIELVEKTINTEARLIKGGSAPYAIKPQGAITDLIVEQTEVFGPVFNVRTTDKTTAGAISILIYDRSGNKLLVPVRVKPKNTDK